MTFKVGDVVRLHSGGSVMTVTKGSTFADDWVECVWHDANGQSQAASYREETLASALATTVTGEQIPTESVFNPPEDWRAKRGL